MENIVFNPYLPSWEYVPDGEPHVFGDRLYIYGSHDKACGISYCEGDYVVWSAPVDNLTEWKYEGVVYKRNQDPENKKGKKSLYAPDVGKGMDGRYYLYYGLEDAQYIGVAVSQKPSGPFEYYGKVAYPDGSCPEGVAFDPSVYVEEDKVYLYYGFSSRIKENAAELLYGKKDVMPGAYLIELEPDMKTVRSVPKLVANGQISAVGSSFEKHPFLEAASVRKINGKYYFLYSSMYGHELCYAVADTPYGPFEYQGVIISNGDVGISDVPRAYMANNHGGIEKIGDQYYIFYHRHTHHTHYSRQGCAEKISICENGNIPQVEMTSCGLNFGPLPAKRLYPAYIICNLHGSRGAGMIPSKQSDDQADVPYLGQMVLDNREGMCLYNMQKGSVCGVKYLDFADVGHVSITVRGKAGKVYIHIDSEKNEPIAELDVAGSEWKTYTVKCSVENGVHAVFFSFAPNEGAMDFLQFEFH